MFCLTSFVVLSCVLARSWSDPVACCISQLDFIADSENQCLFYRCVLTPDGLGGFDLQPTQSLSCGADVGLPLSYRIEITNPCVRRLNGASCIREAALDIEDCSTFGSGEPAQDLPRCYDCHYGDDGQGDQACSNPIVNKDLLSRVRCNGKCFIRKQTITNHRTGQQSNIYYRGCATNFPSIDASKSCEVQNGEKWWFCNGNFCNYSPQYPCA